MTPEQSRTTYSICVAIPDRCVSWVIGLCLEDSYVSPITDSEQFTKCSTIYIVGC